MPHIEYTWTCSETEILLDEEFNVDSLGWNGGDYFQLININGRCRLVKMDPLVKLMKDIEKDIKG